MEQIVLYRTHPFRFAPGLYYPSPANNSGARLRLLRVHFNSACERTSLWHPMYNGPFLCLICNKFLSGQLPGVYQKLARCVETTAALLITPTEATLRVRYFDHVTSKMMAAELRKSGTNRQDSYRTFQEIMDFIKPHSGSSLWAQIPEVGLDRGLRHREFLILILKPPLGSLLNSWLGPTV